MSLAVRVPATSANLGPGFDVLGLALTLYAEVGCVERGVALPERAVLADEHHLATVAFVMAGGDGALWVRSPIPMGRGLGYSAAVRVGGLLAAHVQRHGADPAQWRQALPSVLAQAIELEGHADNAAAALLGGLVAYAGGSAVKVPVAFEPTIVCWVPSFTTRTDQSRARLGRDVPWDDAVFNVGRAALLVAAFASGDQQALRAATQDRLHQPQRFEGSPRSLAAYEAALAAGAWAAWLSGSGPTVACLCAAADAPGIVAALPTDGNCKILHIDRVGATVVESGTSA